MNIKDEINKKVRKKETWLLSDIMMQKKMRNFSKKEVNKIMNEDFEDDEYLNLEKEAEKIALNSQIKAITAETKSSWWKVWLFLSNMYKKRKVKIVIRMSIFFDLLISFILYFYLKYKVFNIVLGKVEFYLW